MIVLAPKDINMQGDAGCHGERMEDVRYHLCREVAEFFALESEVRHAVWA
jgi:hypothetical protein